MNRTLFMFFPCKPKLSGSPIKSVYPNVSDYQKVSSSAKLSDSLRIQVNREPARVRPSPTELLKPEPTNRDFG
ncbi:hypothetical protein K0M31_019841, partial [Melipona bicolor]